MQEIYNNSFWDTLLIFELTFTFYLSIFLYLSVISFTPIIRVLVIETQSLVMFHALCVEEKKTFLMWFGDFCVNNLLPPIFNDWFTFVSTQHSYQTSSSTKEKLFKPSFKTTSYVIIASSIQSWNNAQQKPGSLKTLSSAKIKQLQMKLLMKILSIVFNHDMLIHLYFVFKKISLILLSARKCHWPHAFILLSRLFFINQYIIL